MLDWPTGDKEFLTKDDVPVKPQFLITWNNRDGKYDNELDSISQSHFSVPFSALRSVWISRLGRVDDYWHFIKLIKI